MRKLACTALLLAAACGSETPPQHRETAAPLIIDIADISHHLDGTAVDVDVMGDASTAPIEGEVWISLLVEHEGRVIHRSAPRWLRSADWMHDGRTERFLISEELPQGALIQACVRHRPAREVTDVVCALEIR